MLAFYVVLRDHAVADRKLVETVQFVGLTGIFKCPSLDEIDREEDQRAGLADSATRGTGGQSPEIIDLTGMMTST